MPVIIGIDPGASGGLVILDPEFGVRKVSKVSDTEKDLWEWFQEARAAHAEDGLVAYMELITGFVGKTMQPASRIFKQGTNYGAIRMACIGNSIKLISVTPRVWQQAVGMSAKGKGEAQNKWKNRLKARAQELFPAQKVTLDVADALLIAEYGRLKETGRIS